MKKIVLVLASIFAIGMFASCKQETQDVNVTDAYYKGDNGDYCCNYSGTAAAVSSTDTTTYTLVTLEPRNYSWSKAATNSNYYNITLKVPVSAGSSTRNYTVTLRKVGNRYYSNEGSTLTVTGNYTDSTFTISSVTDDSKTVKFTNLAVTRL